MLLLAFLLAVASLVTSRALARKEHAVTAEQEAWPIFVESINSLLTSGLSLSEAFEDAITMAPLALAPRLVQFSKELQTKRIADALPALSGALSSGVAGEFVALVALAQRFGGKGLSAALKAHSKRVREVNAIRAQYRVRTNATKSVARLGVAAPWVILGLLLSRPETADAFTTTTGIGILLAGLAACVLAYRLITLLGRLPKTVKVYG